MRKLRRRYPILTLVVAALLATSPATPEVRPLYGSSASFEGGSVPGATDFSGIVTFGTAAGAASSTNFGTVAGCLQFEGSTADAIELNLCSPDPASSDKTVTLPNGTTTLAGLAVAQAFTLAQWFGTAVDAANATALGETNNCVTFEGATSDGVELRLCSADATSADKTITLPDGTGTVAVRDLDNIMAGRNTFGSAAGAANAIELGQTANNVTFEGATSDTSETFLTVTDPTADNTITLADNTGTIPSGMMTIETVTTTKTTTFKESGETYTNIGDTDGTTFTLEDNPTAGGFWNFSVNAAFTMTIAPSSGESIRLNNTTCNTSITCAQTGCTITIRSIAGGSGSSFYAFGPVGPWACN